MDKAPKFEPGTRDNMLAYLCEGCDEWTLWAVCIWENDKNRLRCQDCQKRRYPDRTYPQEGEEVDILLGRKQTNDRPPLKRHRVA